MLGSFMYVLATGSSRHKYDVCNCCNVAAIRLQCCTRDRQIVMLLPHKQIEPLAGSQGGCVHECVWKQTPH